MKTRLLALILLAGSSLFARSHWSFGFGIGVGPAYGYYLPPPPPPLVTYVQPVYPGPGFAWVPGYWYPGVYGYAWHAGYWARPPYRRAYWVRPRYYRHRYYRGYWRRR